MGFVTDNSGTLYMGNMEQNAIGTFNPRTGLMDVWVRDGRINWVDSCKFFLSLSLFSGVQLLLVFRTNGSI